MAVSKITESDFQNKVLESKKVVFVDFFAEWCGPCKMTGPIIDALSEEFGEVEFIKIDVDKNQSLASKYAVFSIPTFMIFKDGKVVSQFVGALGKEAFSERINEVLGK